jgi:Methyltransferase domain
MSWLFVENANAQVLDGMQPTQHLACRICGQLTDELWKGPLLDLTVSYMRCPHCEYVQTEYPHWLDRAYANSINDSDTGIMARNLVNVRVVLATLFAMGDLHQRVVDVAGGYGILTRLLRDNGVAALWSDRYSRNLMARGFEHSGEPADVVTAFEAFEHFVAPAAELDKMLAIAPNVLFSTQVIPKQIPLPGHWWYYGQDHGQHIGFYTVNTLRVLAASRGKHLLSDGHSYHLMTEEKLSGPIWRCWLRLQSLAPRLARRTLKSKTWEDHLRVAS